MKVEEICQKKNAGKRYMSRRGGWAFVDLQGRLLWENQVSDDGLRRGVEPVCLHPADLDGWEPEDAPASERIEDADTEYRLLVLELLQNILKAVRGDKVDERDIRRVNKKYLKACLILTGRKEWWRDEPPMHPLEGERPYE